MAINYVFNKEWKYMCKKQVKQIQGNLKWNYLLHKQD